jgi:hypothetical protein
MLVSILSAVGDAVAYTIYTEKKWNALYTLQFLLVYSTENSKSTSCSLIKETENILLALSFYRS